MSIPEQLQNLVSKLDDRQKKVLLGIILFAVALVDYFVLMYPFQIRTLLTLNPKIEVLDKDIKQAKLDLQHIQDYQNQIAVFRGKLMLLSNRIVAKEAMPLVLDNISRLANNANIRINQLMPQKDAQEVVLTNDDGKYYSLPILVEGRGGYHQWGRFINSLESDTIFMSISNFTIAANPDDPIRHSAKMIIKAYVLERKSSKSN